MSTQQRTTTGLPREIDQALALEFVRVTEAAAIAALRGPRDGGGAGAAVAMHDHLASLPVRGLVVIGRGERGGTPVLRPGDAVGFGDGPVCDLGIVVGGVGDGSPSPVGDAPNPLSAVVVAEQGALYAPPPTAVMEKLAVGPDCAAVVDITRPVAENLRAVAAAKGVRVSDVEVAVLDRVRHRELTNEIRAAGARVRALQGGDIAGAIAAAHTENPVDVLLGTGNAADGVVAAAALSCLGGSLQGRLRSAGVDKVLHTGDLVGSGGVLFCGTGVTTGELLHGVRLRAGRAVTESVVLCSDPGTARMVRSEHGPGGAG